MKLPAGFEGAIRSDGTTLHVVVIASQARHAGSEHGEAATLEAGGYFGSDGAASHEIASDGECLLYVRSEGGSFAIAASP